MPENPPRCRTHKIFLIGNNFSSKFLRYSSSVFQLLKFIHCAGHLMYPFNLETHFSVLGNLLEEFDDFLVQFIFPGTSFWNSYYLEVGPLGLVFYSYFLSPIFHVFSFLLQSPDVFRFYFPTFLLRFSFLLFSIFKNSCKSSE